MRNRLKQAEHDGNDAEEAGGTGDLDRAGGRGVGGVAVAAAAGTAATVGVALGLVRVLGVALLTTASVGALDGAVVLEAHESGAGVVNVLGGDQGEGTTDVGKRGEVGTVGC